MKKFIIYLIGYLIFSLPGISANMPDLKYKNIKPNTKIYFDASENKWTQKPIKDGIIFKKVLGINNFYDYNYVDNNYAFSTHCDYDFIVNNELLCFSSEDLKFYKILYDNQSITKVELTKDEVQNIFKDYKIISISDFSKNTHSYKIKKTARDLKIIILNDDILSFHGYEFSSGNAKIKTFDLNGFVHIATPGMIQFSQNKQLTDTHAPWFVLLVR